MKRLSTRRPFAWGILPGIAAVLFICTQASFSQQPISSPAVPLHKVIPIGSHVMSVQGNNLVIVNGEDQPEDLLIDDNVSIWRGKDFSGASLAAQLLQPGDEIKGRGRIDPVTQKLVATEILVNWTFISGTISAAPASVVFPPGSTAFEVTPGRQGPVRKVIYCL